MILKAVGSVSAAGTFFDAQEALESHGRNLIDVNFNSVTATMPEEMLAVQHCCA